LHEAHPVLSADKERRDGQYRRLSPVVGHQWQVTRPAAGTGKVSRLTRRTEETL
jgi:hypothetical protein